MEGRQIGISSSRGEKEILKLHFQNRERISFEMKGYFFLLVLAMPAKGRWSRKSDGRNNNVFILKLFHFFSSVSMLFLKLFHFFSFVSMLFFLGIWLKSETSPPFGFQRSSPRSKKRKELSFWVETPADCHKPNHRGLAPREQIKTIRILDSAKYFMEVATCISSVTGLEAFYYIKMGPFVIKWR